MGKIGELQQDENGYFRMVAGEKIYQIEETTPEKARQNELINLWRMRKN